MKESTRARLIHDAKLLFVMLLVIIAYASAIVPAIIILGKSDILIVVPIIGFWAALVTGIFALFKDHIIDIINGPILKIELYPYDKRDCHATKFTDIGTGQVVAATHYFRVRIVNYGWRTAEDVEVTLEEVKRDNNGRFELDTDFMPLRLFWSHWRESKFSLSIPSGFYRHCDLGFIIDPNSKRTPLPPQENGNVLFWFDVFPRPNTGRTSLLPGDYQVLLSAFGNNAKRASLVIKLSWKGKWDINLDKMYSKDMLQLTT